MFRWEQLQKRPPLPENLIVLVLHRPVGCNRYFFTVTARRQSFTSFDIIKWPTLTIAREGISIKISASNPKTPRYSFFGFPRRQLKFNILAYKCFIGSLWRQIGLFSARFGYGSLALACLFFLPSLRAYAWYGAVIFIWLHLFLRQLITTAFISHGSHQHETLNYPESLPASFCFFQNTLTPTDPNPAWCT